MPHVADLFPLDPPTCDPEAAHRADLLERVRDDRSVFARATGMLETSANADLLDYLQGVYCEPVDVGTEYLHGLLAERVNDYVEGQL